MTDPKSADESGEQASEVVVEVDVVEVDLVEIDPSRPARGVISDANTYTEGSDDDPNVIPGTTSEDIANS